MTRFGLLMLAPVLLGPSACGDGDDGGGNAAGSGGIAAVGGMGGTAGVGGRGGDAAGGGGGGSVPCVEDATFAGPITANTDPNMSHGGTLVTSPYPASYDAGLAAVAALVPATEGWATVDQTVTDATLVATFQLANLRRVFWLADGNAALKVVLSGDPGQAPDFDLYVGQRVSAQVTEVTNFDAMKEITAVEPDSWSLESSDNDVYVDDRTGGPEITSADIDSVVRLTGRVDRSGTSCGGTYLCYAIEYGASSQTMLRVDGGGLSVDDCITYLGPVSGFEGAPQLTVYNPDWLSSP